MIICYTYELLARETRNKMARLYTLELIKYHLFDRQFIQYVANDALLLESMPTVLLTRGQPPSY